MCGIIGYQGHRNASSTVLHCLKKLEYRGYDSWGVSIADKRKLSHYKQVGKITHAPQALEFSGTVGVGHSRWATHGGVTEINAHPHFDCTKSVCVVHNGIIENYTELRDELKKKGHAFESETDTEVIPHLIEEHMDKGIEVALAKTLERLEGRYAIIALTPDGQMAAARKGSPLVLGIGKEEYFLASDVPAFLEYTNKAVFLDDYDVVVLGSAPRIFNSKTGKERAFEPRTLDWTEKDAGKQGHPHYLIKEILEQRESIARSINQKHEALERAAQMMRNAKDIYIIGCGSAGKVALASTHALARIAKTKVTFVLGSEFSAFEPMITKDSLIIAISQSGETADILESIENAKARGARTLAIVNAPSSSLERTTEFTLNVNAGPEKSVCSTKATTAQLSLMLLLTYTFAGKEAEGRNVLENASRLVGEVLSEAYLKKLHALARKLKNVESAYLLGRGSLHAIALEGAIKIQEVSYIHAEGFAGGELKHGPLALIDAGTPVIVLGANDAHIADIVSNAMEVKARGGVTIGFSPKANEAFDEYFAVPDAGEAQPIVSLLPLQALAYYLAIERGCDVDTPRNLAKSVTVK